MDIEARKRLATDMILESEGLADDLEDEEAEVLLDWGLTKAEACALATREMNDEEAKEAIEEGVDKVRLAMKAMNDLIAERYVLTDGETLEELLRLISIIETLPS